MARGKKLALRRKRMMRKRRGGYKTNNNLRSLNPISQRYICKMKYAEAVASDAAGLYVFNLNSIFDPNRTGLGHQPYGHDTLQTLYNRYRVISCNYRVFAATAANTASLQVVALPANEITTFGTAAEYKENPRSRYVTQGAGASPIAISGKVYIPSLVGRTKAQYMADDRFQAQFGATPVEAAVLNLGVFTTNDVAAVGVPINVELVYTVECFDVKNLAQS